MVGQTWKKANKDGSPDRRFAGNYQVPIANYAEIELQTASGLNERYMISNYAATDGFVTAWNACMKMLTA